MKRANLTYAQLDRVLKSFGLTCRLYTADPPPALVYEHKDLGLIMTLPPFDENDNVLMHHLVGARMLLEGFGIAEPDVFDAAIRTAA